MERGQLVGMLVACVSYGSVASGLLYLNGSTPVHSAELKPQDQGVQDDEVEMEFTYTQLDTLGKLRKNQKSGPVSMFNRLLMIWTDMTPRQIAEKVKKFFYFYSTNRHKATTLTPSYHAEAYGCDDNRYD